MDGNNLNESHIEEFDSLKWFSSIVAEVEPLQITSSASENSQRSAFANTDSTMINMGEMGNSTILPPNKTRRLPKQDLSTMTEEQKFQRIRTQNNKASAECRERRQKMIREVELEERQLQAQNLILKEKFKAVQHQHNMAMKAFHISLKTCENCNKK